MAPFSTNAPLGCKRTPTTEKVQVSTQCLDRTRARKGGSSQTFSHSTGNGWALGNMNSIRCSKKEKELKSSALPQSSVTKTERWLPPTFSSLWSHTDPITSATSGKQNVSFNKQFPWYCLGWGRERLLSSLALRLA